VRGGPVPRACRARRATLRGGRGRRRRRQKRAIARAAAAIVSSGDTIVLDVGTTTTAIAQELAAREDLTDVTVFTSSLTIALALEDATPSG
jgi:DeoR family transcriptional regulator, aga operon transcriptional repressor